MAGVKKLNATLIVEERSFTNKEDGQVIKYLDVTANIDGVNVKLSVKKDCKELFNYLLTKVEA